MITKPNDEANVARQAGGRIAIARQRMAARYPFHAHLVSNCEVHPSLDVGTMGVTVRERQVHLLYDPDYVLRCTLDELAGLLHHEMNHVLFGHVLADPAKYPDKHVRMIAEEVTCNEWVPESLPGNPILMEQFPRANLVPGESTDARYDKMAGRMNSTLPRPGNSGGLKPIDNHDLWAEAQVDATLSGMAINAVVQDARDSISQRDWEQMPLKLRRQIEQAARQGTGSGNQAETLGATGKGTISWVQLLRRYVGQEMEPCRTYKRPPRRFPHLAGIIPGKARRARKPRVMAVIDTSGSMDHATLEQIAGELHVMRKTHEVWIVECDTAVQSTYKLDGPLQKVRGRGGTDLRPPFESKILQTVGPDLIINFTDGWGPAPVKAPRVPVIWCLTHGGIKPSAWGQVIQM